MFSQLVCVFCCFYHVFGIGSIQEKNWEYTLISVDSNSSNVEWFNMDLKIDRIARGVYGISGLVFVGADTDYAYIEVTAYRSASGSNDYKALPYKIQNQTVPAFMNSFYKSLLMSSLSECSNAPQCAKDETPILEKNVDYKLNKCQISTENLPSHLMPGFYKVVVMLTGIVDSTLEVLVEVETKEL